MPTETQYETEKMMKRRVLRISHLEIYLGIAKATIHDWTSKKSARYMPSFPKSFPMGSGSVGWDRLEIDEWLENKKKEARDQEDEDSQTNLTN